MMVAQFKRHQRRIKLVCGQEIDLVITLTKNVAAFCPCSKKICLRLNLSYGLAALAEELSRQPMTDCLVVTGQGYADL